MHKAVVVSKEGRRGCGYRKVGGLYLAGEDVSIPCGRLPIPLKTCPCCGSGFKPARGWTWVDADRLIRTVEGVECKVPKRICDVCIITHVLESKDATRAGLIWIGEKFYPTPEQFNREAATMGLSRRLNSVPREFKLGQTFVLLAHQKAIFHFQGFQGIGANDDRPAGLTPPEFTPGIFRVWLPERLEIIVDGTEEDEVIDGYVKRGLTPVLVEITDKIEQDKMELA